MPDVNQLMIKGKGIFVNVNSKNTKSKIRVLYEAAPMGYIVEKSGGQCMLIHTYAYTCVCSYIHMLIYTCTYIYIGKTSEGEKSVLDIPITDTEQTTQLAFGCASEVERFETMVGRKYL